MKQFYYSKLGFLKNIICPLPTESLIDGGCMPNYWIWHVEVTYKKNPYAEITVKHYACRYEKDLVSYMYRILGDLYVSCLTDSCDYYISKNELISNHNEIAASIRRHQYIDNYYDLYYVDWNI